MDFCPTMNLEQCIFITRDFIIKKRLMFVLYCSLENRLHDNVAKLESLKNDNFISFGSEKMLKCLNLLKNRTPEVPTYLISYI
jgi:hypothetical protein